LFGRGAWKGGQAGDETVCPTNSNNIQAKTETSKIL